MSEPKLQRGQLRTADQAKPSDKQHRRPCLDCPWARRALPGWLGSLDAPEWLQQAHGEARIDCHVSLGPQCAGAAIYRANVLKKPRDPSLLTLPADKERVFSLPAEFLEHHRK